MKLLSLLLLIVVGNTFCMDNGRVNGVVPPVAAPAPAHPPKFVLIRDRYDGHYKAICIQDR